MKSFNAEKISEHVYWVGAVDWNVRDFHGYKTQRGTTYNAFLIVDEKITLIDTVKKEFVSEMLERISTVVPLDKIDYIVSNHSEPDHSGGLPAAIAAIQPEKVFASSFGAKTLESYYGIKAEIVPDGSAVSQGKNSLTFVETRMLHWPDSMVSYYDADGILFSQDAFGMHLAGSKLWADEYSPEILDYEARKYFCNIINVQSGKVLALLDTLPKLGLDIKIVAPDHGPLIRKDFDKVLELYRECAEQPPNPRAVVVYATMWHATEMLARAFADGVRSTGMEVKLVDLAVADRSEVMTEVANSGLIAFGAPTMNNNVFPAMMDVLTYVRGLKPLNKTGFAFGSCGWSGEGAKQIAEQINLMKWEQPLPFIQVKYRPTDAEMQNVFNAGVQLAETVKNKCK